MRSINSKIFLTFVAINTCVSFVLIFQYTSFANNWGTLMKKFSSFELLHPPSRTISKESEKHSAPVFTSPIVTDLISTASESQSSSVHVSQSAILKEDSSPHHNLTNQDTDLEYHKLPNIESSRLITTRWTSLIGSGKHEHHFFSAYFDGRSFTQLPRPAVNVMGYVNKNSLEQTFYCLFRYSNASSTCSTNPAVHRHVPECWHVGHEATPFQYLCEVESGIPVTVRLSTSQNCQLEMSSAEIQVGNRDVEMRERAPPKKFGICIGGPLIQEDKHFLEDVIEFVEMSKVMGAEQIVFYVNETQVDKEVLEYLWKYYPETVKTIGWRKFKKSEPLHYYGQHIIQSDCFYRFMYEVEYIAMIDLDEMILPIQQNSWTDMIDAFKIPKSVSEFKFQNNFFLPSENTRKLQNYSNKPVPKYFTRTQRITCFPGYSYRTKLMSRPRFILEPCVHRNCAKVAGHDKTYNVPLEQGMLAHYRPTILEDCQHKPKHSDERAKRFESQVVKAICT